MTAPNHETTKIRPRGSARHVTGEGYRPQVDWQIPAVGNSDLSPEEAREFADYLDERAGDEWLQFILVDEPPQAVAEELRAAADEAEVDAEEKAAYLAEEFEGGQ